MAAFYDFTTGQQIPESLAQQRITPAYEAATNATTTTCQWGTLTQEDYLHLAMDGHPDTRLCIPALEIIESLKDLIAPQQ